MDVRMDNKLFDEQTVRQFYRFFRHKNPTEIRVFDEVKYPAGQSVFVENEDAFVNKCKYYCEEDKVSVYIGARDRSARKDVNVTSSAFVLFEIDEHDGVNKTEERDKIVKFLEDNNIKVSMQGMSGGGWHFYIMHELQEFSKSDEALDYKEKSLNSFKKVLQDQGFDIDGAVFNLERVMRVLGTYNWKRNKLSSIDFINKSVDVQANTQALIKLLETYKMMPKAGKVAPSIGNDPFIDKIKSKWLEGDRQDLAISLTGYLRKEKRLGIDSIIGIIKDICTSCGDDEINQRLAGVRATFEKDEDKVKGVSGLIEKKIETNEDILAGKILIELPGDNSLVSKFAENLTKELNGKNSLFYRQDSRQIIELGNIKNENGVITHTGFIQVTPSRFATLIEKYFLPWTWKATRAGMKYRVERSMTKTDASIVLESHILQTGLPSINRIFTTQNPIIYKDVLTFPELGYDKRFCSWLPHESPKISNINMPLKEAKEIIDRLFKEFCFESKQDYTNALSAFLTPFIKGLFKTGFNTRTPVFYYCANRERSGKDYLAGITGILYEGNAIEESPISSGEYRSSGSNDELRKKLVSAMISGKKRLHFSNNKGHLNNAVFESVITARRFTDRLLGKNVEVAFDNEMDFSFSGNTGITLTPDLANRTIFVKLFLDIENANERKFDNPNLHSWVFSNRDLILSALYSLINNWFINGSPDGSVPFASFPEWARVCGGIMECAGYGNPCERKANNSGIAVDSETDEMKELFEIAYEKHKNNPIDKQQIKDILVDNNLMTYIQWDNRSSQTSFGIKLNKFVGRILSDIRLSVFDKSIRTNRWKYVFTKINIEKWDK